MAKDKNAPKRPSTGYMAYTSTIREELRKETGLVGIALAPFFAKRWAALGDDKKEKLKAKYEKKMVAWRKKNEKYKKTAAYKNFQQAKKAKKWKKAPKDANKPKRNSSAYFLYANEVRDTVKRSLGDASITEIAKQIGENWRNLDEAKKSKYTKKADKANAVYQKKLAKYKASAKYQKYLEIKKAFYAEKKAALKELAKAGSDSTKKTTKRRK